MKNMGSAPISTHLVWVNSRNIHTKFEAIPWNGLGEEVEKVKCSRRQRRRRTQDDRYGHTHSLSVTKNGRHNYTY